MNAEKIRELARSDAKNYDFPLLRFFLHSDEQVIYELEFEQAKETAE